MEDEHGNAYISAGLGMSPVEVIPKSVCEELGISDENGTALYENDMVENVETHEIYCLCHNEKYPFSVIHPFAFLDVSKNSKGFRKLVGYRKVEAA